MRDCYVYEISSNINKFNRFIFYQGLYEHIVIHSIAANAIMRAAFVVRRCYRRRRPQVAACSFVFTKVLAVGDFMIFAGIFIT